MSNTVSYVGNQIVFSGSSSVYQVPLLSTSDFSLSGANTIHTFLGGSNTSRTINGEVMFENANNTQTMVFSNGRFSIDTITSNLIGIKTMTLDDSVKLEIVNLNGTGSGTFSIYIGENVHLTISGNCIGSGTFYVGSDTLNNARNGSKLKIVGNVDSFVINVVGSDCIVDVNDCTNIVLLSGAFDTNVVGNNNTVNVNSGAINSYITGTGNALTNNGTSTSNISGTNTNPEFGVFGNIRIDANQIISTNVNGNITLVPNGDGLVLTQGPVSNVNSVTTKFYVDNTISTEIGLLTPTSVGLGNVANIKNTYNSISPPSNNNDNTQGYVIGSRWIDILAGIEYVAVSVNTDSAVWSETTNSINNVVSNGSNIGTLGVGVFASKSLGILGFRNVAPASTKVSTVLDGNNNILIDVVDSNVNHNALNNYISNEHIDHESVSINAGTGLVGGGNITTTRVLSLDINGLSTGTVDVATDFIPIYDVSGVSTVKVLANTVGIRTHNGLSGLLTDDHTQYALLVGRTGGQILIGGTGSGDNLTISSTSDTTKGRILFPDNINSTSTTTGTVVITGGVGMSGDLHIGGELHIPSSTFKISGSTISTTSGNITLSPAGELLASADPVSALGIVTKRYADSIAAGLDVKTSCHVKASSLPGFTSNSGVLTATSNAALPNIDGYTLLLLERVLYDTGTANANNGIYEVTSLGDNGTPWVLSRTADANQNNEVTSGMFTFITNGTNFANTGWILVTTGNIVLNTTPLTFSQFSGAGTITIENLTSSGTGLYANRVGNTYNFYRIAGSSSVDVGLSGNDVIVSVLPAGVNHNSLDNLTTGDPHTQYTILSGRTGGQTIIGGTGSGDNLTLTSNSVSASTGAVIISSALTVNSTINTSTSAVTIIGGSNSSGAFIYGSTTTAGILTLAGTNANTSGTVAITSTTAGSVGSGAITVAGGAFIAGGLFIGSNLSISGNTINTSSGNLILSSTGIITTSSIISSTNSTGSTTSSNGALVITGGIGVGGTSTFGNNLSIGGIARITNTTNSTDALTGALIVDGGVGINKDLYVTGIVRITDTTNSNSISSGALTVDGGIGMNGNLSIDGNIKNFGTSMTLEGGSNTSGLTIYGSSTTTGIITLSGNSVDTTGGVNITSTTSSTSVSTGALVVAGGVGISGTLNVGDITGTTGLVLTATTGTINSSSEISFTNSNIASSISSAALVITGGVGIGNNLIIGTTATVPILYGSVSAPGGLTLRANSINNTGTVTIASVLSITDSTNSVSKTSGALIVAGGVGITGSVNIGGNINFDAPSSSIIGGTNALGLTISGSSTTLGRLILCGTQGDTTGSVQIISSTTSVTTSSGALIVDGGVGIGGNIRIGSTATIAGITNITNSTSSISTSTGALVVAGGIGIGSELFVGTFNVVGSTITSSNIINITAGGAITYTATGAINLTSSTNTITAGTISLTTSSTPIITTSATTFTITGGSGVSGMQINGSVNSAGVLTLQGYSASVNTGSVNVASTSTSISSTSAAFTVAGGVGINDNLIVTNGARFNNITTAVTANTIEMITNNTDLTLKTNGTGRVAVSAAPTSTLHVATKGYVDNITLSGEVTSVGWVCTLVNSAVISKVLTGYTSSPGTVAATDTIIQAIQKINGNNTLALTGDGVANRVPWYSASRILTNSANLAFNGTTTLLVGSNSTGTVTTNTEGIFQQTGDAIGNTLLRLQARSTLLGASLETTNATTTISELIFKTAIATVNLQQRALRYETRAANSRAGASSFHIGGGTVGSGIDQNNPTLAIGDTIINSNTTTSLCIGGYLTTAVSKLHVTDASSGTSDVRFTNTSTGTTATDGLSIGYDTSAFIKNYENTNMTFSTNSTTRMTITASGEVQTASNPSTSLGVATKDYVDRVSHKQTCRLRATTLPTFIIAGSGVGKTITGSVNGALTVDSVAVAVGNRILVDLGTSNSGIYTVTSAGSAGTPYILTRAVDADTDAKVDSGMSVFISGGTTFAQFGMLLTTPDPITVDTTIQTFAQITGPSFGTHGALTGLNNDDHTQYALLVGRGTGQTLTGGTSSNNNLTLRPNSAALDGSIIIPSTTTGGAGTGALTIAGGVSIGDKLYILRSGFGNIDIHGTTGNTITSSTAIGVTATTGTLTLLASAGNLNATATAGTMTLTTTGANSITIAPGNNTIITGNLTVNNSTNTIAATGSLTMTSTSNNNISILPNGTGQALVAANPTNNLGIVPKQYVSFGGTCRVDAIFGNNSTGQRNGGPFLTISAAITAAISGDTIIVYPGTYSELITMKVGVDVIGTSKRTCIISAIGVTANTVLVTSANSSRLENFTLNISTSGNFSIKGILVGDTADTATFENLILNVTKTIDAGTLQVYGIHVDGAGSAPSYRYSITNCEIVVNSTGTTNNRCLIADTSTNAIRAIHSTFFCNGGIACQTNFASSSITATACHIEGSVADISQTLGTINISSSYLANSNANGLSFVALTGILTTLIFQDTGNVATGPLYTYIGTLGTGTTNPVGYNFTKPVIAFNFRSMCSIIGSGTVTATIHKNFVATALVSTLTNALTSGTSSATLSINFAANERISLSVVRSGTTPQNAAWMIDIYG